MADELSDTLLALLAKRAEIAERITSFYYTLARLDAAIQVLDPTYIPSDKPITEPRNPPVLLRRMRPGGKRYQVYIEIKRLIEQHGPMHIDQMLPELENLGLFDGVKDRRINLANQLSQLKSQGLMTSDNRGTWTLPSTDVNSQQP